MPDPIHVIYPGELEPNGEVEFLTHGGDRVHRLSANNGTLVDFYSETAETTFDLSILEPTAESGLKYTFSTQKQEAVEITEVDGVQTADFTAMGDAKTVALGALTRHRHRLDQQISDLIAFTADRKTLTRHDRRFLIATVMSLPVFYLLQDKARKVSEIGYGTAIITGAITLGGLILGNRYIDRKNVELAQTQTERDYINGSIEGLKALETIPEFPLSEALESEA